MQSRLKTSRRARVMMMIADTKTTSTESPQELSTVREMKSLVSCWARFQKNGKPDHHPNECNDRWDGWLGKERLSYALHNVNFSSILKDNKTERKFHSIRRFEIFIIFSVFCWIIWNELSEPPPKKSITCNRRSQEEK
jgi:hypothetical protein